MCWPSEPAVHLIPMKNLRLPVTLLLFTLARVFLSAQEPAAATPAMALSARTPQELEQLVAPIALYPDALIALILPAAAAPTDIVLAARHVRENPGDRSQIEHRAWDESVKSLTNYPELVVWMDENLTWTKQVGEAFTAQPAEMMQAVQRLRAQARAAGTLVDTPQQLVLAEPDLIRIVPAQPDIIYVPYYEPAVVFVDRPVYYSRPYFTFGVGVAMGSWLAFDCDWRRNVIWVGNRHRTWRGHDWRQPLVSYAPAAPAHVHGPVVRQWRPPTSSYRPTGPTPTYRRAGIAQPAPISAVFGRGGDAHGGSPHFRPPANHSVNPATSGGTQRNSAPRPSSGNSRNGFTGPPASTPGAVVAPPLPNASITAPLAPTVPTPPPTAPRRNPPDAARDTDVRHRGYRGNAPAAPTPTIAAPAPAISSPPPAPAAYSPAPRSHTPSPRAQPRQTEPTYAPQSRSAVSPPPAASAAPAAAVASPAPAPSAAPARSAPAPAPDRRGGRRDDTSQQER